MSQFFTSGGQSFGASASASVLPMNIQDWFPLGLTGWISLPSKVLSRVSSNTTIHTHVYMCVNIRYLFFSFWLTSFCMTVSRSIHVSANGTTSFLSMTEWYFLNFSYLLYLADFLRCVFFGTLPRQHFFNFFHQSYSFPHIDPIYFWLDLDLNISFLVVLCCVFSFTFH